MRTVGSLSVIEIEYKIDSPAENLSFRETDRDELFSREQIEAALEKSGFQSCYISEGMLPYPVYLARLVG